MDRVGRRGAVSTWRWRSGTLSGSARPPRRRVAAEIALDVAAMAALFLIPATFLVASLRAVDVTGWPWTAQACVIVRGGTLCSTAWAYLAVGVALGLGWAVLAVVQARKFPGAWRAEHPVATLDPDTVFVLTARERGTRPEALDIRWEQIRSIEPLPGRGSRTLRITLVPGGTVRDAGGLGRRRPRPQVRDAVTMSCGDAERDGAVLRHFLDPANRVALGSPGSAQIAADLAHGA